MTARTIVLLLFIGLAPAFADEASCTYCYQDGMDARQRGELQSALRFFESGCARDDGASCNAVFHMLSNGEGAPEDDTRAISFGLRSCDLGYWKGCSDLGAALFQKACDGGWQKGCDNVELLVKATQKEPAGDKREGWSFSGENVSFSTRNDSNEEGDSPAKTTIGSMQVGQGGETATFSNVRSSCGMLQLTLALGSAAAPLRQCLGASDTRRIVLVTEDGQITASSVEPDDSVGRCVISALGHARIKGLTCRLEAEVSR